MGQTIEACCCGKSDDVTGLTPRDPGFLRRPPGDGKSPPVRLRVVEDGQGEAAVEARMAEIDTFARPPRASVAAIRSRFDQGASQQVRLEPNTRRVPSASSPSSSSTCLSPLEPQLSRQSMAALSAQKTSASSKCRELLGGNSPEPTWLEASSLSSEAAGSCVNSPDVAWREPQPSSAQKGFVDCGNSSVPTQQKASFEQQDSVHRPVSEFVRQPAIMSPDLQSIEASQLRSGARSTPAIGLGAFVHEEGQGQASHSVSHTIKLDAELLRQRRVKVVTVDSAPVNRMPGRASRLVSALAKQSTREPSISNAAGSVAPPSGQRRFAEQVGPVRSGAGSSPAAGLDAVVHEERLVQARHSICHAVKLDTRLLRQRRVDVVTFDSASVNRMPSRVSRLRSAPVERLVEQPTLEPSTNQAVASVASPIGQRRSAEQAFPCVRVDSDGQESIGSFAGAVEHSLTKASAHSARDSDFGVSIAQLTTARTQQEAVDA